MIRNLPSPVLELGLSASATASCRFLDAAVAAPRTLSDCCSRTSAATATEAVSGIRKSSRSTAVPNHTPNAKQAADIKMIGVRLTAGSPKQDSNANVRRIVV
jgi:hypothetical protein